MKSFILSFGTILFTLFLFSGCGFSEARKGAEDTMKAFHKQLEDQNYDGMMDLIHKDGFIKSPREQWLGIFRDVGSLGKPEVKQNQGFHTEASNGKVTVELSYTLKFKEQTLTERVVLRKEKGEFKIYGYHVK